MLQTVPKTLQKYVAVLLFAVLSACAPVVHLNEPDVRLPLSFEAAQPEEAATSVSLDRWWDDFNDPQLGELIGVALEPAICAVRQSGDGRNEGT